MNFYTTSILALLCFYVLLVIVVFFFQRGLLYHPTINNYLEDRPKLKKYLPQALTLFAIIFVLGYFTYNAQVNMGNRGIVFGFGFLTQESSFDIQFSLIDYDGSYSYGRAYLVGLLNTILVSVIGIFFATLLGVIVGISRLSSNYFVSKFAETYV